MATLRLTRESVSMADDAFDHTIIIEIDRNWKISEILTHILKLQFLPKINGGKATWSVATNKPIAVIAQQWELPELICEEDYPNKDTKAYMPAERLHFNYHAQQQPEIVLSVLRNFRTTE